MRVQRLSWAGVRIESGDDRAVIDLLGQQSDVRPLMGAPRSPLLDLPDASVSAALVTHLRPDHYDPATLSRVLAPGGPVLTHPAAADAVASDGFRVRTVYLDEPAALGALTVHAVPAVDGLGEEQVSWVVTDGTHTVFHGGDTLWHGHWWRIARQFTRIDLAFLPIGGGHVRVPASEPSGQPASMTPEQAAAAAQLLRARVAMPIHYGLFHDPSRYRDDSDDVESRFLRACGERGVVGALLCPGQSLPPARRMAA